MAGLTQLNQTQKLRQTILSKKLFKLRPTIELCDLDGSIVN